MQKKRTPVISILIVLMLALLVTGGIFWIRDQPLPEHQGKTIDYWFERLPCASVRLIDGETRVTGVTYQSTSDGRTYGSKKEDAEHALEAIRSIGTNGLPFILGKLQRREAEFQKEIRRTSSVSGQSLFDDATPERAQAITALLALSPLPEEWLNEIRHLSTNAPSAVAGAARAVLAGGDINSLMLTNVILDLRYD